MQTRQGNSLTYNARHYYSPHRQYSEDNMLLASYLDAKTIFFESQPVSREEIYHKMVARICSHYHLPICDSRLVDLILARDSESTTAYPTGIAMPHVRMEGFDDTLISICFLEHPIDYDGTLVSLIVLFITEKAASRIYLNIVSALLKLSKNEEAMQQLKQQKDGVNLIAAIKRLGITIKENLTIADIMDTNPLTVHPDQTLKELAGLMSEYDKSYVPVVDERGRYLGEVDILCLLKVGVPDYLMMLDNLNFLGSYEPLENLFEQEDLLQVADIMRRDQELLSPESSIIEASHEMIQNSKRFYSVVQNGSLVGVISAIDIFKKVIRA